MSRRVHQSFLAPATRTPGALLVQSESHRAALPMTRDLTRLVTLLGTLGAGAFILAACGSTDLSLGTNVLQVAPSQVSGTVTSCAVGSAHPNVCCTAGPNEAASCWTYPGSPFTQCDSNATTYPDPRSCCPLDGSSACSAATATDAGAGDACTYACLPGWYLPSSPSNNECCQTDSDGNTQCVGFGGTGELTPCGGCPSGWQTPQGLPDLCCAEDANSTIECFSQALSPG